MAGYSGTPLQKKLGIKPGHRLYVVNAPAEYFNWISPLPEDVKVLRKVATELDMIHWFIQDQSAFKKQFDAMKKALAKNGMLWVSWPKKASKVPTDLDENIIREYSLDHGLVDVKVCAVSDVWSGLKLVYRLKDR